MGTRLLAPILALALLGSSCLSADEPAAPAPLTEPFRVLLLGDSISIGYTPVVQRELAGRAHVVRPTRGEGGKGAENCAGTNNGVQHLERWLAIDGGNWDLIHFNFGLHDLKRVDPSTGKNSSDPGDPHQAGPRRYEAQLRVIVEHLQATGARLVFATTTPIPEGELVPHRAREDVALYNRIALRVMDEAHIPVDDLYGFVMDREPGLLRPADVHFTPEGSQALGERVAQVILEVAGLASETATRR